MNGLTTEEKFQPKLYLKTLVSKIEASFWDSTFDFTGLNEFVILLSQIKICLAAMKEKLFCSGTFH
jgi:hypothetical protein